MLFIYCSFISIFILEALILIPIVTFTLFFLESAILEAVLRWPEISNEKITEGVSLHYVFNYYYRILQHCDIPTLSLRTIQ